MVIILSLQIRIWYLDGEGEKVITVNNTNVQPLPEIDEQEDNGCVHYWLIDVPSGPVSDGKCRVCGQKKEFRNSLESGFS
jgi:hypothetical protein